MFKLELISRQQDRESFDCGSDPLNRFLKESARQQLDRGISRTYVLVDPAKTLPRPILGYFSLTLCEISSEFLPSADAKGLPRVVSGVKLARLAVGLKNQREGLGTNLLFAAMRKTLDVFESAGGIGLFVDAKDLRAKGYYERFGFHSLLHDELRLFLPMSVIRKLVSQVEADAV